MFDKLKFWGKKPSYEEEVFEERTERSEEPVFGKVDLRECKMRGLRTYVEKMDEYHNVVLSFFCDKKYEGELKKLIPSGQITMFTDAINLTTYETPRVKHYFENVIPFMILDSEREGEIEVHCSFNRVTKTCI